MNKSNPSVGAEAKMALRAEMRRRRALIADRPARSFWIAVAVAQLCRDVGPGSLAVLAFVGVGSEPDTREMIQRLLDAGHSVFLPRVEGPDLVAVAYRIDVEMTSGAFGIPQPSGPPQDPATLDLVLVPGLAFTTDGRRLGQGGGYYDRFLTRIRPDCITAGIAFAEQLVGDVPTEPYDQTLTMIVTDAATESGR